MTEKKKLKEIRLIVFGDSSVGKTSILNSFKGIEFKEDITATTESDMLNSYISLKDGSIIRLSYMKE